jgi:hypothetical protein
MTQEELLALCQSKGLSEIPEDIAVYNDGFIYLQPVKIKGHDADNLIVGYVGDRYSVALGVSLLKVVKRRKRLMVSFIDGNYDAMIDLVIRTGGKVLPNNFCIWSK